MSSFKPMLASKADASLLRYPLLLSPKYDGIRAVVLGGKLLSRTLKPIPNAYIQERFRNAPISLEGLDGELIVGSPTEKNCFQATTSGVMKRTGEPDFTFYVFDRIADGPYRQRFLVETAMWALPAWVIIVPQISVQSFIQLAKARAHFLNLGYEGVMLRDPEGPYKYGRSTAKEGWLLKDKPFEDDEGTIVDFEEKEHNDNAATKDALGHTKRSSAKAGKRPANTLGTLILSSAGWPSPVRVGTGFDDALRQDIWLHKAKYKGRTVKYRYQAVGTKDKPRIASFIGFRDKRDM
jgi:DNA ligase-1